MVSVLAPLIVGIAILIIIKEGEHLVEPFVVITVGKTMSTILFFSSLPFLINPTFYPIGFGMAFSFVEIITFVGSRAIGFSDLRFIVIQVSSIVFSFIGFVLDRKLRNGVQAQKSHITYLRYYHFA